MSNDRYKEIRDVLAECRDIAMEWTLRGRIPECGKFGEIAQDLDALCAELENFNPITDAERDHLVSALEDARLGLRYVVRVYVLSDEIKWSEEKIDEVVEDIIADAKKEKVKCLD